jgi:murein DD-endopeptidase MepM/ murein hydrolase activator NlpD
MSARRRRTFDLSTVRGLALSGIVSGAAIAVLLLAWRVAVVLRAGTIPPEEPVSLGEPALAPELRARALQFPVPGVSLDTITDTFDDPRSGGRRHHALDIMAPRGTPVVAVEDGRVLRLWKSGGGGISLYQADPSGRYSYYYAHLDRYAEGLADGQELRRGQVLGYVGSTGNASENAPHLHFAVFERSDPQRWWTGRPVDPFPLWR